MNFYDQVLREMIAAIGGALFVGNALALFRRRRDAAQESGSSRARAVSETGELVQAPVLRTVAYAAIGLVMLVAGLAALVSS